MKNKAQFWILLMIKYQYYKFEEIGDKFQNDCFIGKSVDKSYDFKIELS